MYDRSIILFGNSLPTIFFPLESVPLTSTGSLNSKQANAACLACLKKPKFRSGNMISVGGHMPSF